MGVVENFDNSLSLINKFGLEAVPDSMLDDEVWMGDECYTFRSLINLHMRGGK